MSPYPVNTTQNFRHRAPLPLNRHIGRATAEGAAPAPSATSFVPARVPDLQSARPTAEEAPASSALSFAAHTAASLIAIGLILLAIAVWGDCVKGGW